MPDEPKLIAIAVVQRRDRFLIGQRPAGKPLAGCWEFPGGHVRAGELPSDAAIRECLEETGISTRIVGIFPEIMHDYAHDRVRLHFFACEPLDDRQAPRSPFRWVARSELGRYRFPDANREILARLSADRSPDADGA